MSADYTLHHHPFDPASRHARLALGEKRVAFSEALARYWEPDNGLEKLNPASLPPVLVAQPETGGDALVLCELPAILGWLDDLAPEDSLWGASAFERSEARRLTEWMGRKFDAEVDALLLFERLEKRLLKLGSPDMDNLRAGRAALKDHLAYLNHVLSQRDWLAGRSLTHADFAAGARLSVHDYLAEMSWSGYPALQLWYMRLKSRPCFRPLLADRLPGLPPPAGYANLDF